MGGDNILCWETTAAEDGGEIIGSGGADKGGTGGPSWCMKEVIHHGHVWKVSVSGDACLLLAGCWSLDFPNISCLDLHSLLLTKDKDNEVVRIHIEYLPDPGPRGQPFIPSVAAVGPAVMSDAVYHAESCSAAVAGRPSPIILDALHIM